MTFLDEPRYPFHLPQAQELYDTLVLLQPAPPGALLVASRAGIDTAYILTAQPIAFLWKDILDAAARAHLLRELVRDVHGHLRDDHPARALLADLLADRSPAVSSEPRDADGRVRFLHDDDTVSEPEALLFADDLTLPVGRLPALISTLERLVALAPGVCKLTVDVHGSGQYGTGFRIGTDLILTNWHVLHRRDDGAPATAVTAEFRFEDDGAGGLIAPVPVPCAAKVVAENEADDWAVIRADEPLDDGWPVFWLAQAAVPALGGSAYVVQHPLGGRKRVGFVRNQVSFVDDRVVQYLTDTDVGSSGSPVIDHAGRLIGLHHRGGLPQEVAGKPPLRKNEGVRIGRVLEGLTSAGIEVGKPG